ncbi:MAG: DUF3597 domain-containing protein [Tsuneonella sp.]
MSIFSKIKDAILGHKPQPAPAHAAAPSPTVDTTQAPGKPAPTPAATSQPAPLDQVDVENRLDSMPGADRLNWRTSIVDLMKLIGVPSDYESRKALAQELGRTDYSGSAEDNVWLHKRTMQELAGNGGKVPAQFLD